MQNQWPERAPEIMSSVSTESVRPIESQDKIHHVVASKLEELIGVRRPSRMRQA